VEGNLRGGDVHVDDFDRELATAGSSTKSLSFSVSSSMSSDSLCIDFYSNCLDLAEAYTYSDSGSFASGNTGAVADTYAVLAAASCCKSFAKAFAQTCAFAKIDGKANVNTSVQNNMKSVSMDVTLSSATLTIAIAKSVAKAKAYAEIESYTYTDVYAYCQKINYQSLECAAYAQSSASTDLETLAVAKASSKSKAGALAGTAASAYLQAQGTSINYINSVVSTFATSWTMASAEASVRAFANAYTSTYSSSFAGVCVEEHKRICGEHPGDDICKVEPDVACASAGAWSYGYAEALALACANAFATAITATVASASISANVNCASTPAFSWTCLPAYTNATCAA
jgi:hypothetical protein